MVAIGAGLTVTASSAHAGDVEPGKGDGTAPVSTSQGGVALKFEHKTALPTSIQTPEFGPSSARIQVGLKIEPVKDGGPLFSIDMPKGALVQAAWSDDKRILLKGVNGSSSDGTVKVRHSLAPKIDLKLSAFGLNTVLSYDATELLNKIPGARFEYDEQGTQKFAPWGFTKVDTTVIPKSTDTSSLFTMGFEELPEFIAENATGVIGLSAQTKPVFSYKTTRIGFSGVSGALTSGSSELSVDAIDGDYMEVMTAVEGEMSVTGELSILPYVHVDYVGSNHIDTTIDYELYSMPYTVEPMKVPFQSALVHIPLPNVHAPEKGVNLGDVKVGSIKTKKIIVENTGEMAATLSFKSDNAVFEVPSSTVTVPSKGKYELEVSFQPDSGEPAEAEITVASNDPDSPYQVFKVGANGADVGSDPSETDGESSAADSGCGCKAAGTSSSIPSWAGVFGLALGGSLLASRRKRSAK